MKKLLASSWGAEKTVRRRGWIKGWWRDEEACREKKCGRAEMTGRKRKDRIEVD